MKIGDTVKLLGGPLVDNGHVFEGTEGTVISEGEWFFEKDTREEGFDIEWNTGEKWLVLPYEVEVIE